MMLLVGMRPSACVSVSLVRHLSLQASVERIYTIMLETKPLAVMGDERRGMAVAAVGMFYAHVGRVPGSLSPS